MIHPDLATMLAVVTTDYPLEAGRGDRVPPAGGRATLQRDLGRRRALDERLRDPARERRERRRATPSDAAFAAALARGLRRPRPPGRRRRRGDHRARRDQRHRRRRRRAGEGDRPPDRHLAARQDRALRPRRQLGPRADGGRVGARGTAATRRSTPTASRSATTAPSSSTRAPRPTSSRTSPGPQLHDRARPRARRRAAPAT